MTTIKMFKRLLDIESKAEKAEREAYEKEKIKYAKQKGKQRAKNEFKKSV